MCSSDLSATMVGVSITIIGIVRLIETHAGVATIIDNLASVVSVLFLLSTLLSYFALRTPSGGVSLERYADLLLLAGLVLLVACGFMLAWELGTFPVTAP